MKLSEQVVPGELIALADSFSAKVNQGLEKAHGTGYGGSGFKFTEEEDEAKRAAKKTQGKEYGFEEDKSDSEEENKKESEAVRKVVPDTPAVVVTNEAAAIGAAKLQHFLAKIQAESMPERYEEKLVINDWPQNARWKVTHRKTEILDRI